MVVSADVPYYPLALTALRDVQDYEARHGRLTPVAAYGYAAVQLVQARGAANGRDESARHDPRARDRGFATTPSRARTLRPAGDVLEPNCDFYRITDGKFAYERQAHRIGFMLK